MHLDELPGFALHEIFLKCEFRDIEILRRTCQKFFNHIAQNRMYYSKHNIVQVKIKKTEDGQRRIEALLKETMNGPVIRVLTGSLENALSIVNPSILDSYDHEELLNMSRLWWKQRKSIVLHDIIDYRKYLPLINSCEDIILYCDLPKNLTEILELRTTKNLRRFRVLGKGELTCTDEDLRKIASLSNNLSVLKLCNLSESSIISNDAILDLIEMGSLYNNSLIHISTLQSIQNMEYFLKKRKWVVSYERKFGNSISIRTVKNLCHSIDPCCYNKE